MQIDYSLYLVTTNPLQDKRNFFNIISQAIEAGVTCVQYREKLAPAKEIMAVGKRLLALLRPKNIPLIINDHVEIARLLDADGVHLGQGDACYSEVRALLGYEKIIGLSLENIQQAKNCKDFDVNYFGVGPIFPTLSKTDVSAAIGIDSLRAIRQIISKPLVAIGGITLQNAGKVLQTDVDGIAVIAAIMKADDPSLATTLFKEIIQHVQK